MYLVIDNSLNEKIIFHTSLNTKWVQHDFDRTDKGLLSLVDDLLKKMEIGLSDLQGIAVVVGVGKFTATRIATTVANTLALTLKIPVLGVEAFSDNIGSRLAQTPVGIYISAQYSAPANIGGKK